MTTYKKIVFTCISLLIACMGYATDMLRERVYVQTDKQIYLAGELMWVKMLTTDIAGKPIPLSKVGYIELFDENSAQSQVKIELQEGVGQGCIELPFTLTTGNYRLVAYTRYMQNEGESCFFEKNIGIINTFVSDGKSRFSQEPIQPQNNTVPSSIIRLTPDQIKYPVRESGLLTIENLPANLHTLSVSIAGSDLTDMPDNILLWKKDLSSVDLQPFTDEILAEYEGHIVKGRLIETETEQGGYADEVIPMIGFTGDHIHVFNGKLTPDSDIYFYTKGISGTQEIVSSVFNDTENKFRIDIESPFVASVPSGLPPLPLYEEQKENMLKRSIGLQASQYYTYDAMNRFSSPDPKFRWKTAWNYKLDEYTRFTNMEETVIEYVLGLRFRRIGKQRVLSAIQEQQNVFTYGNTLVLLDGVPLNDHSMIFHYDPYLVEELDIYRGVYIFGGHLFDGIASFKTYQRNYPGLAANRSMQFYQYAGPQLKRYFYAPDYSSPEAKSSRLPDFRHTLLWEPDLQTNGEDKIAVPFQTSDFTGEFRITVEGITRTGECIYSASTIYVGE